MVPWRLLVRTLVAALLVFALGLGVAPGQVVAPVAAQEDLVVTYVGQVDGTDAYVGLATNGDKMFVYVCDGTALKLHDEFKGAAREAQDGVVVLKSENGHLLGINVDSSTLPNLITAGGPIIGNLITADGGSYFVYLEPAVAPGALWVQEEVLSDGAQVEGGWVVLNDGSVRGQVNVQSCPNGACGGLPPGHSGMNAQAGGQNTTGAWGGPAIDADGDGLPDADSGFEYGDLTNYQPPAVMQRYNFAQPAQQQMQHTVNTRNGPVTHTASRAQP
jgi:hypothetical protein